MKFRSLSLPSLPILLSLACSSLGNGNGGNEGGGARDAGAGGTGGSPGTGGSAGMGGTGGTPEMGGASGITFTPPPGAYPAEQNITITSSISGATIRYTIDRALPTATTGEAYSEPVKMAGPMGTLSNASGATMLKAVAVKNGAVSAVYSGIYEIESPSPAKSPSPLQGIAHVAYHVTNLAKTLHFWVDYLGFGQPFMVSSTFAVIKINDQQFVELHEGPLDPKQYQLLHYGYQVSDATAYRTAIAAAGVTVTPIARNELGNTSFFVTDPDGHLVELVQYERDSMTAKWQGQGLPSTQLFGFVASMGGFCANQMVADDFYIKKLGFDNTGDNVHLIHIPNTNSFYENGTLGPNQTLNASVAGKKDQIDLLNFRGMTIQQTVEALMARDPAPIELHLTNKGRYVGNIYDPDGSRVELNDE